MPYGEEIATILPSEQQTPLQIYQQSSAKMERRRLMEHERQMQLAAQKKKDDMDYQNWADQNFDASKYGTDNIETNQVVQNTLAAMRDASTNAIRSGVSGMQIMAANAPGINNLRSYVANAKAANTGITGELTTMGKSESLDMEKLKKRAIRQTFFNDDGSAKTPDQIKPVSVRELLRDNPTEFVKTTDGKVNHGDLEDYIQKQKPINTIADAFEDVRGGGGTGTRKSLEKFKVAMLNGQEIVWSKGSDGKLDPKLKFKSDTVNIQDKNGKDVPITMLNEDAYSQYFSSDGAQAALLAETKQRNPNMEIDPRTATGQKRMRETALDVLNSRAQGTSIDRVVKNTDVKPNIVINTGDRKEASKLDKERGTSVYKMFQIKNGDLNVTEGRDPKTGLTPVTDVLPDNTLWSNRKELKPDNTKSKQAYSEVYIDDQKNYWVKDNPKSDPRMINPKDEYGFFRKIAEANGISIENFDKLYQETHPAQNIKNQAAGYKVSEEQRNTAFTDFVNTPDADPTKFADKWKHRYFTVTQSGKERKLQLLALNRKKNGKYDLQIRYDDTGKLGDLKDLDYKAVKPYIENPVTQ